VQSNSEIESARVSIDDSDSVYSFYSFSSLPNRLSDVDNDLSFYSVDSERSIESENLFNESLNLINDEFSKFRFLCWNVAGLAKKRQFDSDFFNYINEFDGFCLMETWVQSDLFHDFNSVFADFNLKWIAAKASIRGLGRASEGYVFGVKKQIKNVEIIVDKFIYLLINSNDNREKLSILPIYLPTHSWDIKLAKVDEFIQSLSHKVVLVGDFNARTANKNSAYGNQIVNNILVNKVRKSNDTTCNIFGNKLIDFCNDFNFIIANGKIFGEKYGNFTFIRGEQCTVIDYLLLPNENIVDEFKIDQRIESDHMPLNILFNIKQSIEQSELIPFSTKLRWQDEYIDNYNRQLIQECINLPNIILGDVNEKEKILTDIIRKLAHVDNHKTGLFYKQKWYDKDCLKAKQLAHKALIETRIVRNNEKLTDYKDKQYKYWQICKEKKSNYYNNITTIFGTVRNSLDFWKAVGTLRFKPINVLGNFKSHEWINYFKILLNPIVDISSYNYLTMTITDDYLDRNFNIHDLDFALTLLKRGKATGIDGIPAEFYKYATIEFKLHLLDFVNHIFCSGQVPDSFKTSILFPLFKSGDKDIISNYRGICFQNTIYKVFMACMQLKLRVWVNVNNKLHESQAGFRPLYSTLDDIYVLMSLIENAKSKSEKLFAFFIDFKAAFDSVNWQALYYKLSLMGVSTKFISTLDKIYNGAKCRIWTKNGLTEDFYTNSGVKQGCILSPLLFSLFINDLDDYIESGGIRIGGLKIRMCKFADDIVFFAPGHVELQLMIRQLHGYVSTWGLTVNLSKSKIMVFRKGGRVARDWTWTYAGQPIEVVNTYKYLGISIATNGSLHNHFKEKLAKAKNGINQSLCMLMKADIKSIQPFLRVFEAVSQSILCYGAQVWGYQYYEVVERIYRFFVKKLLWLPMNTPNYMILAELGRNSINLFTTKIHLDYIEKTLKVENVRYINIISKHMIANKLGWVKWYIEKAQNFHLSENNEFNQNQFMSSKNQLLQFLHVEEHTLLVHNIMNAQKHLYYKDIMGETIIIKNYLNSKFKLSEMRILASIRCEALSLFGKPWANVECRNCTVCSLQVVEDVIHFIGECTAYIDLRKCYFDKSLMLYDEIINKLNDETQYYKLIKFTLLALQKRKQLMEHTS